MEVVDKIKRKDLVTAENSLGLTPLEYPLFFSFIDNYKIKLQERIRAELVKLHPRVLLVDHILAKKSARE